MYELHPTRSFIACLADAAKYPLVLGGTRVRLAVVRKVQFHMNSNPESFVLEASVLTT